MRSPLDQDVVAVVRSVAVHTLIALCAASVFFAGVKIGLYLVSS